MGTAAVPAATMAIGAASSAYGASQQNKAIRGSMAGAARATTLQRQQISDAALQARQQRIRDTQKIRARLRVSAAEAGVGMGGSFAAAERQNVIDSGTDLATIGRNAFATDKRLVSEYDADVTRLGAGVRNPVLSGFTGGLQGLQAGLQISQGVSALKSDPGVSAAGTVGPSAGVADPYVDPNEVYPLPSHMNSRTAYT